MELALNRLGEVISTGGRTFRMMTLVVAGDCSAQVPVHVESQPEDYEALLALYGTRVRNLTTLFADAEPKWLEFLLGIDDAGLMARLDGSVLLSHCETALLEEVVGLCSGDFDASDLAPAVFTECLTASLHLLSNKPETSGWATTPSSIRAKQNSRMTFFHPLSDLFSGYEPCRIDDEKFALLANNPEKIAAMFVQKLGYGADWAQCHDGSVPADLGQRLRVAFPDYWDLRDDWITERPSQLIDTIRPELNRRLVAVPADDAPQIPSRSAVRLPLPTLPQREVPDAIQKMRIIRLQLLFEILGSDRTRVLNEMKTFVSNKQLKAVFAGTSEVPPRLCRHLESFLQLAPGWLDGFGDTPAGDGFSVPELRHGLPTAEANALKNTSTQSRTKKLWKRIVEPLAENGNASATNGSGPAGAPSVPAPIRPRKVGRPLGSKGKAKLIPDESTEENTPALRRSAETWRLNVQMMTKPDGAASILAETLGWSVRNVNKRVAGDIKMTADDAELLEETLKLGIGWMEEVRKWSDLPIKAQQLLGQNDSTRRPPGPDTTGYTAGPA